MGNRKKRQPGPQTHAEGQHGEKTHRRFLELLAEREAAPPERGGDEARAADPTGADGRHRLHEDRQQHDAAEQTSEKVRAIRQVGRGDDDENVLAHARIPRQTET